MIHPFLPSAIFQTTESREGGPQGFLFNGPITKSSIPLYLSVSRTEPREGWELENRWRSASLGFQGGGEKQTDKRLFIFGFEIIKLYHHDIESSNLFSLTLIPSYEPCFFPARYLTQ